MAETSDQTIPATEVTAPDSPAPRRSGVVVLLAGGLLAGALGFAAAQLVPALAPPSTDLTALQAQVQSLRADLDRLSETPAETPALIARLAELEQAAPPDLSPLTQRIDQLEQALNQLKSAPAPSADPAAMAALQARLDGLEQGALPQAALDQVNAAFAAQLAEAEARLAAVKSEAEAIATATIRRAGLQSLQAALDTGAPYVAALASLPGLVVPPELADHAATGLPSLPDLRASFPDAARAALDAALQANMGESWADRVSNFLLNQTGARSLTPREGSDPDAILSRVEAALTSGDLPQALTEASTLPPVAQTAMEAWLTQARLRQDAIQAVQTLTEAVGP